MKNALASVWLLILIASSGCLGSAPFKQPDSNSGTKLTNVKTPKTPEQNTSEMVPHSWQVEGRLYSDLQVETEGRIGDDFDVDVSPDGSSIAFASTAFTLNPKIFTKDIQAGGIRQLTSGPSNDIQPKLSPDGRSVAFASNRYGNYDILLAATSGSGTIVQLTNSEADEIHPSWSPDGKKITYCARTDKNSPWSIWIVDLSQGQKRTELGPGLYPEWSPDGSWIAFQRPSSRGQGWYGIWIVPAEGGSPRQIKTEAHSAAVQPAWSPNSKRLVYCTASSPWNQPIHPPQADDLWIVDIASGKSYHLTQHPKSDYSPSWGLDGRIYFSSARNGRTSLFSIQPSDIQDFLPRPDAQLGRRD